MSLTSSSRRRWTDSTIESELRAQSAQLGHFPTRAELVARGLRGLWDAMRSGGGADAWQARIAQAPAAAPATSSTATPAATATASGSAGARKASADAPAGAKPKGAVMPAAKAEVVDGPAVEPKAVDAPALTSAPDAGSPAEAPAPPSEAPIKVVTARDESKIEAATVAAASEPEALPGADEPALAIDASADEGLVERVVSHDEIAARAYELYERGAGGDPVDIWLQAEHQLAAETAGG
ncbi:MAG: hypothetical protein ABSG43_10955 [Solirubrobacteraceae bacterium]|jgi:hypothetical protein